MAPVRKKSKSQIRKEIIEFLSQSCGVPDPKKGRHRCGITHRNCLVLATSYRDRPRATPLEFFHEGLTIYIFGEGGGKIANIKRNRNVSATIYQQPLKHSVTQKSLQLFGKAELINMKKNPALCRAKSKTRNMYVVAENLGRPLLQKRGLSAEQKKVMVEKILSSVTIIKITPDHIILREYHPDFTMPKYEWKK